MKWFKHFTDARCSESLAKLQKEFGWSGIGRWWRLVEMVAEKMDKTDRHEIEYPISYFSSELGFANKKQTSTYLKAIAKLRLSEVEARGDLVRCSIKNLLYLRDNYTKDLVVTTKRLPSIEVEVEVEKNIYPSVRSLVELWKKKNPINGRTLALRIKANDLFEVWVAQGKTMDEIGGLITNCTKVETLPWEIEKYQPQKKFFEVPGPDEAYKAEMKRQSDECFRQFQAGELPWQKEKKK
jgi:hypothetical protein